MAKGFKLLLVADEDPEFRNYIRNIVKERIGDMEQGVLVDVIKQAILENSGKLANSLHDEIVNQAKKLVDKTFGQDRFLYQSEREKNAAEIKSMINVAIYDRVKELITPEMVDTAVRSAVERRIGDLTVLANSVKKDK